ncbi:hypothetical protein CMK17_21080 [Candidatus Poribacteria bacterium]|jgi:hypothetical protein|nr:hypothetical protein [Candidatus Poribacteria bacterium]|tara:strand:+ start:96 stop:338 length:243 start_codon:yes stop_codon:yes gene_type:complete
MVKDYDKEDPFEMKTIEIPGGNIVHQAQVMSEEFRDMGTTEDELLNMFSNPFYGGLYMAYVQLGRETVEKIVFQVYKKYM